MESKSQFKDEFLREMIGKSTLETPSDDFVEKVMDRIQAQPVTIPASTSFYSFLKSAYGYFILTAILVGFFMTSDIPFMNWIPGKQYFLNTFLPYFNSLFAFFKSLTGDGKNIPIPLMILAATGLFFLFDRVIHYRKVVRDHPLA